MGEEKCFRYHQQSKGNVRMRIETDKEEYKDLTETKEEFVKTVRKLENIIIENIKLTNKLQAKEQECEELRKEINGYKIIIEKIRQEIQEDETCESQECGCDNYEECIECLKNTILNIINEERNDFVQDYKQALEEIEKIAGNNLCDDDCDVCPDNCLCDWKEVKDIISKSKEQ